MSRLHSPSSYPARFGGPLYCLSCQSDWPCAGHLMEEQDAKGLSAQAVATIRADLAKRIEERVELACKDDPDPEYEDENGEWLLSKDWLLAIVHEEAERIERSDAQEEA